MNKRLITILQYVFFLGLGIFLVWWSVKDLSANDMTQIKSALRTARYWLIVPVFIILLFGHYIRAWRWRLLIEPLGYQPRQLNTFFAVMIGYLANQAVPRLGEVLKCTVLARYEKIPADKLIGTIILERIIDAITLLIIFGITLAIQPHLYSQLINTFFHSSQAKQQGESHTILIGLILVGLVIAGVLLWMYIKKKNVSDLVAIVRKIFLSVVQGVSAVRHLKKRGLFILLTIVLWSIYLSGGFLGFIALQETEHYGIQEAFTVLSAGSVGMIITPGGIGAYAYLIQQTMILYGLNEGIALAFGWILWLAQTSVIVLGGLFSFIAVPYYNKNRQIEKS